MVATLVFFSLAIFAFYLYDTQRAIVFTIFCAVAYPIVIGIAVLGPREITFDQFMKIYTTGLKNLPILGAVFKKIIK